MITLYSVETDVLALVYYHSIFFKYEDVFCETGSTTKHANTHRFVSIEQIMKFHGESFVIILPQIHALSGCAPTAAPYYIGKKSVVKTVLKHGPVRFANLSSVSEIDIAAAVNASHALVALWYNPTEKFKHCHEDLNILRTRMASTKIKQLYCLTPCG